MSGFLEDRHPLMATCVASTTHIQCRAAGYGSCYVQAIHGLISEVSHDSLVIRHSFWILTMELVLWVLCMQGKTLHEGYPLGSQGQIW